MQQIDEAAMHTAGMPRLLLMEQAGSALAQAVRRLHGRSQRRRSCVVVCGTGYNGGDGLCAAWHLVRAGWEVRTVLAGSVQQLKDEPAVYARILQMGRVSLLEVPHAPRKRGPGFTRGAPRNREAISGTQSRKCSAFHGAGCRPPPWGNFWYHELAQGAPQAGLPLLQEWLTHASVILDALLGIGLTGSVRPLQHTVMTMMNHATAPIVSADIPSGLDGDTGRPHGIAVKATVTVTFGRPKQGCFRGQGPAHVGRLIVEDLGIPPVLLTP